MTVKEVLNQIEYKDGLIISKTSGKAYTVEDFTSQISQKLKWTKKERTEFEKHFIDFLKPQTDDSKYIEALINKYKLKFSDGVYMLNGDIATLDTIYRFMWKEERLLPVDVDDVMENVEKISEPLSLQEDIFKRIQSKAVIGESQYLRSLRLLYPYVEWEKLLYNILVPNTKPLFHIFYDNGVGGTGKSTLLEVLTMIVGDKFVSNVLLDQFSNRFMFANMLGKYLNIGDDNGKNEELANVGTLKSIITGNRVTVDRKNIAPIEVRIFAKQLFATNILPYIDFTDGGIMRRLNIVEMSNVIPPDMKLCKLDEDEIGHIIYEVLHASDLKTNNNNLAIETSPLYRFYDTTAEHTYSEYVTYCVKNGFRTMNVINFEVKSRFIKSYLSKKKNKKMPLIEVDELPW